MSTSEYKSQQEILSELGLQNQNIGACTGTIWETDSTEELSSISPINGQSIASTLLASNHDFSHQVTMAGGAFRVWRNTPAPKRGELVRKIADVLREKKQALGALVSLEMGKIFQEGLGEVQEMIDICDFAVGLSRQLYGSTTHSEREKHRLYDQYHPLGIVGVITAFNFPVAVWAWNAMIALVCGNSVIWKPSTKTPLCAIAVHKIIEGVLKEENAPEGLLNLLVSESVVENDVFISNKRIALISATGSTAMGKHVARVVSKRLGKTLFELGGNNALIVTPSADLKMALHATLFGAVGTAGQRCTTTRRLIVHASVYDRFVKTLVDSYAQISARIGSPLYPSTLIGPLIDQGAVKNFRHALEQGKQQGARLLTGGEICSGKPFESGCYVVPALVEVPGNIDIVKEETFGPILYVMKYETLEQAIDLQNEVSQGLSSSIFTLDMREAEIFLSASGSDCGIANVNLGTSGAEIGGAFGGEKDTGGGRESGSDAWKAYMRRQTNTINFNTGLPLAQGISFDF